MPFKYRGEIFYRVGEPMLKGDRNPYPKFLCADMYFHIVKLLREIEGGIHKEINEAVDIEG